MSTEEGVVNAICGWSALYFTMVYFLRIDLHLLEIIVEMYSALLVLRPVASPNLEVCTRDVQYFSPSLDRLQWSDACNAAYIVAGEVFGY